MIRYHKTKYPSITFVSARRKPRGYIEEVRMNVEVRRSGKYEASLDFSKEYRYRPIWFDRQSGKFYATREQAVQALMGRKAVDVGRDYLPEYL